MVLTQRIMAHLNLNSQGERIKVRCPPRKPGPGAPYHGPMAATTETRDPAYRALAERAGVLDRSELGKLALTGGQSAEMLNGQVSNDVEALAPGTGCYAALLNNKGKMLGDLRVLNTGDELLLLTERASLQALFDQLRRGAIGWDAELHKRTVQQGLLSVIGPLAREVAGAGDLPAAEHANRRGEIGGAPGLLVATHPGGDGILAAAGTARVGGGPLAPGGGAGGRAAAGGGR